MRNVQSRRIAAPPTEVGRLLDHFSLPDDRLWPSPPWPALRLDDGLTVGSRGGHGPIRYHLTEYEPGRRVRFAFDPAMGLNGYHELAVYPEGPDRSRMVHTLCGRTTGGMRWSWPVLVRWLHEALLQDLLDNAERAATGGLAGQPARRGLWVRLILRLRRGRRVRQVR